MIGIAINIIQPFSGINTVLFYSNQIFLLSLKNKFTARIFTLIIGINQVIFSIIGGILLNKLGRKASLLLGEILCLIFLILLVISTINHWNIISSVLIELFSIGFALGLSVMTWIYIPEILPDEGISISSAVNWIGTAITGFFTPILIEYFYIYGTFSFYAIFTVFSVIFTFIFVIETKGLSHKEIHNIFI